jgi:hypothetical protein
MSRESRKNKAKVEVKVDGLGIMLLLKGEV